MPPNRAALRVHASVVPVLLGRLVVVIGLVWSLRTFTEAAKQSYDGGKLEGVENGAAEDDVSSSCSNPQLQQTASAAVQAATTATSIEPLVTTEGRSLPKCHDKGADCEDIAKSDRCFENPQYTNFNCRKSCGLCRDERASTNTLLDRIPPSEFNLKHGLDMGAPQNLMKDTEYQKAVEEGILSSRSYMKENVQNVMDINTVMLCRNMNPNCTLWSLQGQCEANPTVLKRQCAPACHSCRYLTIEGRCPVDPTIPSAWQPGDLDRMFQRITTDSEISEKYTVEVLSSPETTDGPWIIIVDDILTEHETTRLIELGTIQGYQRSAEVGNERFDGTHFKEESQSRTSSSAFCHNPCDQDATVQEVLHRISAMLHLPKDNSEHFQLLKYEIGQFYKSHHDLIQHQERRQPGLRILTAFFYLNDVPQGGGTKFGDLNVTVFPKRGRLLLWPSVLNDQPNRKDRRTMHEALSVEDGVKYAANLWFHERDFRAAFAKDCQ